MPIRLAAKSPAIVAGVVIIVVLVLYGRKMAGCRPLWIGLALQIGGAAGNLMNVAVQQPGHTAIGASTAVFAALGLLSAYLWTGRRLIRNSWARRLSPVVGGVIMLAWFGTGTERTDIVAHLTGFMSGFVIGAVFGRALSPGGPGVLFQWLLGMLSVGAVGIAWALALA